MSGGGTLSWGLFLVHLFCPTLHQEHLLIKKKSMLKNSDKVLISYFVINIFFLGGGRGLNSFTTSVILEFYQPFNDLGFIYKIFIFSFLCVLISGLQKSTLPGPEAFEPSHYPSKVSFYCKYKLRKDSNIKVRQDREFQIDKYKTISLFSLVWYPSSH